MKTGPEIITDGLVFGYDTHTYSRFYNGVNTTNHLISLRTSFTNTVRTNGKAVAGEEEVDIPTIGKRTVKYVEYFNNYNNGDDLGCCPNLFNYHGGSSVPLEGNQSYTYSIVYKHTGGYTHPNFMYRYRYKEDGTYIGEGGLHSTARRTHLGDGWYHAWGSWTTNSEANYGKFYSFLYNYGTTTHRFYVAAISLVKNNSGSGDLIIPPNLLLEPNTSVTSTQSLIDLKKTTNIDVSNVSFDSTGQPTFDGTDDSLTIPGSTDTTSDAKTIEIVFKMNGSYSNYSPLAIYANGSSSTNRIWLGLQNNKFQMHGWGTTDPNGTTTILSDEWYICTFSYNKSTQAMKMYTNGVLESSTTNSQGGVTASSNMNWYLGTVPGGWQSVTYSDVDIPIFKIYDRILSDSEVKQNFDAYKNRFEL